MSPDKTSPAQSLYLVSRSRELGNVMRRATHAAGCEIVVRDRVQDLPETGANVKAVVVESSALTTVKDRDHLRRLATLHNTLVLNEVFDDTVVELLRGDLCNHAIHIDRLDMDQLIITINKLLTGDIFGVDKYLPWGTPIQTLEILDYDQKRKATEAISRYVRQLGCRAPLVSRIENTVEELLLNALYDAPAEHEATRRSGFVQRMLAGGESPSPVTLRFASGGNIFVLAVTDVHGKLSKGTIVERLGTTHSALEGGGGSGLFVLLSKATRVIVNVAPGSCTEVITFFDLDWPISYQGVRSFQYFEEQEEPRAPLETEEPRAPLETEEPQKV